MNKTCMLLMILILLVWLIYRTVKDSMTDFNFELDKKGRLRIYDECRYEGIRFGKDHELGECSIAIQIVPLVNNVLEIGGGSGKVSHIINKKLQNKGNGSQHVVVEPGAEGGWNGNDNIYLNRKKFNDQYTIVRKMAQNMDLSDLSPLNGTPECLYVDCEGCLEDFHKTELGKYVLSNVKFIVNEMDGFSRRPTLDNELRKEWKSYGFRKIGSGYGCHENSCETEVWSRI